MYIVILAKNFTENNFHHFAQNENILTTKFLQITVYHNHIKEGQAFLKHHELTSNNEKIASSVSSMAYPHLIVTLEHKCQLQTVETTQ